MGDIDDRKALVQRFYGEQDDGNPGIADEVLAPGFRLHLPGLPEPLDLDGTKAFGAAFYAAFPDLRHTIDAQIAEGDRVASRLILTGTQRGEFRGVPATGLAIRSEAVVVHRVNEGRLAEQWAVLDLYGLLAQLGALEPTGRSTRP